MISICDSNNSLPKQGGMGWVSCLGLLLWVSFFTLHRKMLISKWLRENVKSLQMMNTF